MKEQIQYWKGKPGKEYTVRNFKTNLSGWDSFYKDTWGYTRIEMNELFIGSLPKDIKILEVGCNLGMQLTGLQRMGFTNLYGIDLQDTYTFPGTNIIKASAYDIPFKDGFFDLVFTSGLLIHISPEDLHIVMSEIYRCTNKFIWGFEYYSDSIEKINYRGKDNLLWKADYARIFMDEFSDLKLDKKFQFMYKNDTSKEDSMYLLKK